jgi:hypothetical protein
MYVRPPRPPHQRWPSSGPRVLLVLLLFALPIVLIPAALGTLDEPEAAPRPSAREELDRALAQQGILLSDQRAESNEGGPVDVAGSFVGPSAFDAPPVEVAGDLMPLEDEGADWDDSFADVDEADEGWAWDDEADEAI